MWKMGEFYDFTEKKTAEATGEKLIDRAELRKAVKEVMCKQMNEPELEGMAKLLVPMIGTTFACEIEEILFGKKDQEG